MVLGKEGRDLSRRLPGAGVNKWAWCQVVFPAERPKRTGVGLVEEGTETLLLPSWWENKKRGRSERSPFFPTSLGIHVENSVFEREQGSWAQPRTRLAWQR